MTGYILDDTLIEAFGHGSDHVANLIAGLDAQGVRMAVPLVTLATAQASLSTEQCDEINGVVDSLDSLQLDPLNTVEQATELADMIGAVGEPQDMAAAHAIHVAKRLDWPIVTVNRSRWHPVTARIPWPLELIELSEPD